MFLLCISWLFFCAAVKCSRIFDTNDQDAIHVSNYCPSIHGCEEGTHVMCMYYDPKKAMGPLCSDGRNFTVTEKYADRILNLINEIRIKVANGVETGKGNLLLPKGYGIFRLVWDNELATFAQIWANQCQMRHDLCRATRKFPNPGQMTGIIRFKYPSWESANYKNQHGEEFPVYEVPIAKLERAMDETIRNAYVNKRLVTTEMINSCPDVDSYALLHPAKIYLQMVRGSNTHVGCGVSTYVSYFSSAKKRNVIYNTVEMVCNFSGEPEVGQKVYETDPPHKAGYTQNCGCPPGYDEDEDCLCIASNHTEIFQPVPLLQHSERKTCVDGGQCSPPVVLLPIFTVEDAPPEKLYQSRLGNASALLDDSLEIFNVLESPRKHLFATPEPDLHLLQSSNVLNIESPYQLNKRISNIKNKRLTDVRNRYFNKNFMISEQRYRIGSPMQDVRHVPQNRIPPSQQSTRNSIFTRVSKFELPFQTQKSKHRPFVTENITNRRRLNALRKDVTPRRDFTNLPNIVTAYLNKKHTDRVKEQSNNNEYVENLINSIVPKHRKFGFEDFNISVPHRNSEIRNSFEEADNKLLSLLDNLEQEVKHIELNENVKEIVDAKIRKIYGNVVGNPNKLTKSKHSAMLDDLNENAGKRSDDQRLIDTPMAQLEMTRPLKRSQNSLIRYEKPSYEPYRRKFTVFDEDGRNVDVYGNGFNKNDLRRINDGKFDDFLKDNHDYKTNGNQGRRRKFDNLETDNYYLTDDEDLLGIERRKYYQEKLDNLERKLQNMRSYRRQNDLKERSQYSRPVQNTRSGFDQTRPDRFYMPDGAKYLHGF